MSKYRKKPVVIEAHYFAGNDPEAWRDLAFWCGGRYFEEAKPSDPTDIRRGILIPTLEGVMTADFGDWIIKGVKGEFYPCKPEIFAATYEPV